MRIAVCVKHVPEGPSHLDPSTKRLDRSGEGALNHFDANGNVRAGVAYLSHLLHDFHGNTRLALAGWYQGERAVRKHGLYKVSKPFVRNVLALEKRM